MSIQGQQQRGTTDGLNHFKPVLFHYRTS